MIVSLGPGGVSMDEHKKKWWEGHFDLWENCFKSLWCGFETELNFLRGKRVLLPDDRKLQVCQQTTVSPHFQAFSCLW